MSKTKRNICLLNDSFPPIIDGVANAVVNYAYEIEENHGHSLVVTPGVPDADDSGYSFPVVRYPSIDTRKMIGYVTGYPFSPEAAYRVKTENIELLHTHCPVTSALLARQLGESGNLPIVMTYHTKYDIDIANAVRSKFLREGALNALLQNINSCDEIWTVSEGAGENLRSIGYKGDYIVMPNGVDLPKGRVDQDLINEVTGDYDIPEGIPVYLFIGRMMWYKGIRITLDALKKMDTEGLDFRMVFVGGGGDYEDIRSYCHELKLDGKCFFTGAISDRDTLRAWYSRADLFLFPSTFDTNGLVVREAASCGTASVIVAGSCAAEGVQDMRNGFLIEENADSLASKLTALYEHPEIVKRVGELAGDELYISWHDSVNRACERYEIVIDKYKSGKYPKRSLIDVSFMKSQGALMESLGLMDATRRSINSGVQERVLNLHQGFSEGFRDMHSSFINDVHEIRADMKNELVRTKNEFWELLDRYQ